MEHTQILSAGIDIGTSTSQVVISRLTMENTAGYFSVPSVSIVEKKVIYQSPIYLTPLVEKARIDGEALAQIVAEEYAAAGVSASQVETGAVIITGESARKENAALVLEQLSCFAGDFVVATAGPDLESVIAGQGSGAWKFSEETGTVVANIDIGGGTANVVVFDGGEVISKDCIDIGGRQVTVDSKGIISYISSSAGRIAYAKGLNLKVGESASIEVLYQLCCGMCEVLGEMLGVIEPTGLLKAVRTRGASCLSVGAKRPIRYLCFSGGVADCINDTEREPFCYGDIGVLLGKAIRENRIFQRFKILDATQTIRATVIGAGSYTTEISGSTISCPQGIFPMKNIPVLKLTSKEEYWCWKGHTEELSEKVKWFLEQNDVQQIALAIDGHNNPEYEELKCLAETVGEVLHQCLSESALLLVIVQTDIAKALGQMIERKLAGIRSVAVIDEIHTEQNHFVDIGRPVMNGLVIPVVVKTLLFS